MVGPLFEQIVYAQIYEYLIKKTLNQIIFFLPPKSEYFFQQHLEKKHTPFQVNWSFPNVDQLGSTDY
jgi:hypothetical protein